MREAVIVSTARTPIGKAYRGAFNDTESPTMAAPVIREAVARERIEPGEIDDLIMGTALRHSVFTSSDSPQDSQELPVFWAPLAWIRF
jgi:acetyl-CoA C-acetyltransferase